MVCKEVIPTPRGTHPNSLANLKKGTATQFGAHGDSAAREAQKKSTAVQAERRSFRDGLLSILNESLKDKSGKATDKTTQDAIIAGLVKRAISGDTRAFEIIRDTIGEKPVEQINVNAPDPNIMEEIRQRMAGELQ